jgi:hypothetical protein
MNRFAAEDDREFHEIMVMGMVVLVQYVSVDGCPIDLSKMVFPP